MRERGVSRRRALELAGLGAAYALLGPETPVLQPQNPQRGISLVSESQPTEVKSSPDFTNGITLTSRKRGELGAHSAEALDDIKAMGANAVAIAPTVLQDSLHSTEINRDTPVTSTDRELIYTIRRAKDLGLTVVLKPHVNMTDLSLWRGDIGQNFTPEDWRRWHASYRENVSLPYAAMAQETGVDLYVDGTEFKNATTGPNADVDAWRGHFADARNVYEGPITYAANHSGEELAVPFWDDENIDFIGVDLYPSLTDKMDATVDELKQGWIRYFNGGILVLADTHKKKIIGTEWGSENKRRNANSPWVYGEGGERDDDAQARYATAAVTVFNASDMMAGHIMWERKAVPDDGISHQPQVATKAVLRDLFQRQVA